jgi:hypothetical protein
LNGRRRSWLRNKHGAFTPSTRGIYHWSWRSFTSVWLGSTMSMPSRLCNCHGQSWKFLMPWSTWVCSLFRTSLRIRGQLRMSGRWLVSFWSICGRNMPPTSNPGSKASPIRHRHDPRLSHSSFFFAFDSYVMYISIFLHMLMYKGIGKLVSLHP